MIFHNRGGLRNSAVKLAGIILFLVFVFCGAKSLVKAEDTNTGSIPVLDDYYEFTVPSTVTLKQNGNKLENTIDVSVTAHQRKWLDVSITSQNNFNLVGKNSKQKISYALSETNFSVEPQYSVDNDDSSISKEIKVSSNVTNIADDYSDTVNFTVSSAYETRTIVLDCNGGTVNGQSEVIYTVRNGNTYGKLPTPVKNGFIFVGWLDCNGNTIYSGSVVDPNTQSLTAKWSQILSIAVNSYINGKSNSYFQNCGNAVLYINGNKYTDNADFLYCTDLKEGDTFKVDNISPRDGYTYIRYISSYGISNPVFEYYDDGKVKSISGTFSKSNVTIYFDFENNSPLQQLIRNYNLEKITIDEDKPTNVNSIGSLDIFQSDAEYYLINKELHIFNPNGGKVVAPQNCNELFSSLTIKQLDMSGLDVSNTTNISNFFVCNYYLESLDVSKWDTSNVRYAYACFHNCEALKQLDISNWNTSKLINGSSMFDNLKSVTDLKSVENLDMSNLQNASNMFGNCINVKSLDVSHWNTKSLKAANGMFWDMQNLETINLTNLNLTKCNNLGYFIGGSYKLKEIIGFENLDFSNVRYWQAAFCNMKSIEKLDLTGVNFDNVLYTPTMLFGCTNLKEVMFNDFHFESNCYDVTEMFAYCPNLQTIYTTKNSKQNYIPATSTNMFIGCTTLVGGDGTAYDPTFTDATAARIDGGPNEPGYFTDITNKPTSSNLEQVTQQTADSEIEESENQEIIQDVEVPTIILQEDEEDPETTESE